VTQQPSLHVVEVRCSTCGTAFEFLSTAEKLSIDVCSNCHAYTGRERTLASSDRIERFNRRRGLAAA
jgi:large subunit ribosomal protein L31